MGSLGVTTFDLRAAGVDLAGRAVLDGVDLEVGAGEAVALVGPSGAGKTTLLRIMNGTLAPTRGEVRFEGAALSDLAPSALRRVRARVGFVHQDHSLVPNLYVSQNVLAGGLGQGRFGAALRILLWPARRDLERAHALLSRLGIERHLFTRTDALSGGEQQRVALARALFQEPHALLADEPVASVDPARARSLIELMRELASERGLALVVSLHDLGLAREFFPRVIGLREGRVVFDGSPEELSQPEFDSLYRLERAGDA